MTPRLRRPLGRVRGSAWPVAQAAVAAGVAWFLAHVVIGHQHPVFAPTAAVVALAANVGGRGRQAVEMLVGVGVGVAVGELLVLVLGVGAVQVALAAAAAMLTMAAALNRTLPLIQAGSSAVLVVALQNPSSGGARVLDALVGAGVALLVSQILFPPSPVAMLAGAGRRNLERVAGELRAISRALDAATAAEAEAALGRLRDAGLNAAFDLAAVRRTARQVSRRTLRGRREADRLRRLDARLGEADLLLEDAILLARATSRLLEERGEAPGWLRRAIDGLARAVGELAGDPESPETARRARRFALEAARTCRTEDSPGEDHRATLAAEVVLLTAADVLRVAGESEDEAAEDRRGAAGPEA